jgi:outer membrane receptor for ferrienterochelin and colicins
MRTRLILQAILLLSSIAVLSQSTYTYEGFVQNEGGEKLIGVQFISPVDLKVIALSDENGHFQFTSALKQVSVSYLGYEAAYANPKSDESKSILTLIETSGLLNAIVISENKRETSLKNATVSLEIIKPSLLINTAPTNIEETIGRINGVQVVDNQPTIRSGSGWSYGAGSRVQVLVDGIPMLSGDAGQPLWTFLPTEGIDGVEIIKGASSVIYGSSALNGVINIKTKKPSTKPYTQVNLSTGIYDLPNRQSLHYQGNKRNTISNLTLYHASAFKDLGVTFGLNLLNDESYKMSDYDKRARASLGLRKTIAEKNLTYGINTTYQHGKSGSFLLWESYDLGYTSLDSGATDNSVNRLSIDPYITWYKGKFTHTLNTRYLNINNQVDNGDTATNQSNSSNLVYAEYQTKFSLIPSKFYTTGGIVAINTVSESPLYSGNQTATNYAAYLQADKTWNRLTASAGARYELFELNTRKEGKPVVRAGLNFKAANYTFLRASYGQGYRFPSIAESFIKTTVGPVSIFANNNLSSETGTNLELGVKQGLKIKGIQMMIDIAVFEMAFNNMMEFTFGQWGPVAPPLYGAGFKTLNTGKARVRGSEFNIGFQKITKIIEIEGFVGYTYANSKALEPNKQIGEDIGGTSLTYINTSSDTSGYALKYRPKHLAKADVMVRYKKWHLGAGISFQSEVTNVDAAFTSPPISLLIPGVQESIDKKLTAFTLINTRIGYEINNHWKTNLLISNITNMEYAIRPADLGAPRSLRLQLTYTLDKSK